MFSNYTIKRMIPRLIIAAILVNVSYQLCLLAVDVSNVVGWSIFAVFDGLTSDLGASYGSGAGDDGQWKTIMAAILVAGVAAAGLAMALSIPVIIASLLALVLIAFILIARQALIILLIAISPLAFVAYLLPNTEKFFQRWQTMFFTLLMVFPVVGMIFGASTLASSIILGTADGDDTVTNIIAAGVLALPLFAVPAVLKGALAAAGTIGARLQGMADGQMRQANTKGRTRASERYKNSLPGRFGEHRRQEADKRRNMIQAGVYNDRGRGVMRGVNAVRRARSRGYGALNQRSGKFGSKAAASGIALSDKETFDEADRQMAFITEMPEFKKAGALQSMVEDESQSIERRAAAAKRIAENGSDADVMNLASYLGQSDSNETSFIQKYSADKIQSRSVFGLSNQDYSNLRNGELGPLMKGEVDANGEAVIDPSTGQQKMTPMDNGSYEEKLSNRVQGKFTAGALGSASPDVMQKLREQSEGVKSDGTAVSDGAKLSDGALETVIQRYHEYNANPTNDKLDANKEKEMQKIIAAAEKRNSGGSAIRTTAADFSSQGGRQQSTPFDPATLNIDHGTGGQSPQTSRTSPPPESGRFTQQTDSGIVIPGNQPGQNQPPR